MSRASRRIVLILASFLIVQGSAATEVPTPESVLGFEPGERAARHSEIVRYLEALAEASPRARLVTYARTHEGRDLVYLLVSSEANMARLDDIRESIGRIADPRPALEPGELDELVRSTPAVAYMAYAIHGDEFSSADAALRLAFELVGSEDDETRAMRDNLVVLIDPLENPDGRERILSMIAAYRGAVDNPDPDALNHSGFWPWGRGNHYFFDLNRDWFALVHPESLGRAALIRHWQPQLVVDAHEMGWRSTYLFNPPRAPYNPELPGDTLEWWHRFGADQARAFDEHGWSYYTREWNEEFFPGYGSSRVLYQGAMGILYEQASTDAQPIVRPHGMVVPYADSVEHQLVSSRANLSTLVREREALLRRYRSARAEAVERGRQGPVRVFYILPEFHPRRAARLVNNLLELGIEVERLSSAGRLKAARQFWSDGPRRVELLEGSFRVRLDQPDGLLAKVVLSPHTAMAAGALAEEREHLERRKGSRIYDTTAWSPLLAAGVDGLWSDRLDGLEWEPLTQPLTRTEGGLLPGKGGFGWVFDGTEDAALTLAADLAVRGFKPRVGNRPFEVAGHRFVRGSFLLRREENPEELAEVLERRSTELGVTVVPTDTARSSSGPDLGADRYRLLARARIALAAGPPLSFTSVGAAWHLLDERLGVQVSLLDVSRFDTLDLARYNVLVLPDVWGGHEGYRRALGKAGQEALTRWVERGGTLVAMGSGAALLADPKAGLSKVRRRRDVLGEYPSPRFGLDAEAVAALERMQATGLTPDGKVVEAAGAYDAEQWPGELGIPGPGSPVLGPGTWALAGEQGSEARRRGMLKVVEPGPKDDKRGAVGKQGKQENADEAKSGKPSDKKELERLDERLRRFAPSGALLSLELNRDHWLSYGAGLRLAAMVRGSSSFIARDPVETAARFAGPAGLHLGGLLWPEAAGRLAHTAFLTREGKRRGQLILFAHDPNFRGYFDGTSRLFLNAVLLGPGLGTQQTVTW